jgi:hypothetical protein
MKFFMIIELHTRKEQTSYVLGNQKMEKKQADGGGRDKNVPSG